MTTNAGCRRRLENQGGQAGAEILALGVLVFVVGTLFVANAWAVVDAKFAAAGAAREATRAYVTAPEGSDSLAYAEAMARASLMSGGRSVDRFELRLSGARQRCGTVTFEVRYRIATVPIGGLGGWQPTAAVATSTATVDPYRDGIANGPAGCPR